MIEPRDGIAEDAAQRFYDRHGARLELSERFEERAKSLAFSWVEARPGQRVLELGVGCGHFLAHAAAQVGSGGRVLGVDLSTTMLSLGRARAPGAGLLRASAARLPLDADCVDWVFSSYVLDLLPRALIDETLAEVRRVLRPEGRLVLCGLTEGETLLERGFMGAWKLIQRVAPNQVGGCRPLRLAPILEAAGFRLLRREHVGQLGTPSEVLLAAP